MTFVTAGLALAGLAAVAVPIVIFLLWRQRRRPVDWAAMRFLLEAFRKHRRRLQLEQLLLLTVRCLIPLLLGLALARPVLEATGLLETGGGRVVWFVVDDGLVAGARDAADESALERHVDAAVGVIEGLDATDRVGLVTAARPARVVLDPPSGDHAAVIDLLRGLHPSAAPSDIPGALDRLGAALADLEADHDNVFVYLLSDFRRGSVALDEGLRPSLAQLGDRVVLLAPPPAVEPIDNVQIVAVEPARSLVLADAVDGSDQVRVRLARQGGALDRAVSRVHVSSDEFALVEPKIVEWMPGQSEASVKFLLEHGGQRDRESGISVRLEDDGVAGDNERHTVLDIRRQVRAILLDRRSFGFEPAVDRLTSGQWIRRALAPAGDGTIDVVTVEPAALDTADLRVADVAVLPRPDLLADSGWSLLARFVERGGLLIVTPPDEAVVHRWTDRLRTDLGLPWQIAREVVVPAEGLALADEQPPSALLRMISSDLNELTRPIVAVRTLPVTAGSAPNETVLAFGDGTPMVVAGRPRPGESGDAEPSARGLVVYFAVAPQLEWTTLPAKPLMVPLWQELVRQGLSAIRAARPFEVGERPILAAGPAAAALVAEDGTRIVLDPRGRPSRALDEPGVYHVVDHAGEEIGAVAVNVEADSGNTDAQPENAVKAWLAKSGPWSIVEPDAIGAALNRADGGSPLAGLLLVAVLVLVILETLLARWFSHAEIGGRAAGRALRPSMARRDGPAAIGGAA